MSQLTGKVAVVTGGSRGIGLAVAGELIACGAHVVIAGRSTVALDEAVSRLSALSASDGPTGDVEAVQADVGDSTQATLPITCAAERFGGLDILINNAGVGRFGEVADLSPDDWREVLDTNLNGVFYCTRAAIPLLRKRRGGWIINVSSLAGSHPFAGGAAYCASKAGLDAFTTALMQEVRHDDIRVSSVAPGSVGTGFAGERREAAAWKLTASDVARTVIDLMQHDPRSLPSRIEIRPAKPRK